MKLGFVTAIMDGWTYEEVIDYAQSQGFQCLEVACWPSGAAERRYAGVAHIDVTRVLEDADYAAYVLKLASDAGISISSLAFYPNPMDADLEKRAAVIAHLETVIRASQVLGVNMVTTFVGRDQAKTVEENLALVAEIWPPIVNLAADCGVKIAIENCPMLFGPDQWPGGQNIMTTPALWEKIFEILPQENFGLNFDPSHFVWQGMDYLKPIYQFKEKLFHIHFKDIKMFPDKLNQCGTMAYPLDYMAPKLPGLGDVNWSKFISALTDVGYQGYCCIEVEDRAFEDSKERILHSIALSKKYIYQYI